METPFHQGAVVDRYDGSCVRLVEQRKEACSHADLTVGDYLCCHSHGGRQLSQVALLCHISAIAREETGKRYQLSSREMSWPRVSRCPSPGPLRPTPTRSIHRREV